MEDTPTQKIMTELPTLSEADQQTVLDAIYYLKAKAAHPNHSEVMLHFHASMLRNKRLGQLLAQ